MLDTTDDIAKATWFKDPDEFKAWQVARLLDGWYGGGFTMKIVRKTWWRRLLWAWRLKRGAVNEELRRKVTNVTLRTGWLLQGFAKLLDGEPRNTR